MRQAHQFLPFRAGAMCALGFRLSSVIGLALAVGIWAPPEAWALTVSPTAISFQAVQGGTNPPSQSLSVSKGNNKPTTWTATDSAAWLTVSPGAGSITSAAQMTMAVNTSGLGAGIYTATITINVVKGGNASVPVTLIVSPAPPTTTPPPPPPPTSSSTTPTTTTPPPPPPTTSTSTSASLSWSPPTNSTGVAGYNVYMGTASGVYGPPINVGNVTSYVLSNLAVGTTYYFVVKDYNTSGVESAPSNEVSKSIY